MSRTGRDGTSEEVTDYFRRFAAQRDGAAPSTAAQLLTQAPCPGSGTNPATLRHRSTSTRRRNAPGAPTAAAAPTAAVPTNANEEAVRQRLLVIKSQKVNHSPMDPNKYAPLLPSVAPSKANRKCLVLDVDETLVHSSFNAAHDHDLHLQCPVNGSICHVYVAYRPHVHSFLEAVEKMFEIVIFTASVSAYCNPLMNRLDPSGTLGPLRLFREHCSTVSGSYVKDLSLLGRSLDQIAIVDNSPVAYLFQPRNAIPIVSWFDDPNDTELLKLLPMLENLARAPTVYDVLDLYNAQLPPMTT